MSKPFTIINGQPIPWSVWVKLRKKCVDEYEAALCLYRCRNKEKIVPYIMQGIRQQWIYKVTLDEEQHPAKAKTWVESNILHYDEVSKCI